MLDNKKIKEIDKFISDLPHISNSASKVLELSKNKNAKMIEYHNIIKRDPVLTGKVLKLVNSAYYSLPKSIVSLVKALTMLGTNTVKNLVLSSVVIDTVFNNLKDHKKNSELFLKHSVCVGTFAKTFFLNKEPESENSEEYFIAGLLHDIGKFPIFSVLDDEYSKCYDKSLLENIPMIEMETKEFGFNHSDIGEKMLNMWKLGSRLTNMIKYHHNIFEVPEEDGQFTAIISLADMASDRINRGFFSNSYTDAEFERILTLSEIPYDFFAYVENNPEEIIKKSEAFMEI